MLHQLHIIQSLQIKNNKKEDYNDSYSNNITITNFLFKNPLQNLKSVLLLCCGGNMKIDKQGLINSRNKTVEEIIQLLKTNNKVGCIRYTGYGKSFYIVKQLINKLQQPFIIVVPNISLVQQYKEMFNYNKNVKVITYQSIKNINEYTIQTQLSKYKYIICDECHHLGNNKWRVSFDRFNNILKAKVIGLTATPLRGDNINVIEDYFNNVQVQPLELIDGISLNFIPKIKYVVAYASIDNLSDYKLSELDRYKISNFLNVPEILQKHIPSNLSFTNTKILVYVPNIKYIKEGVESCKNWFKDVFPQHIINIYTIHSKQMYKYNIQQLNKFKTQHSNNVIDIMVSVDMLTEGLHLPTINVEIMLRKTKSPVTYFQQIGRVINGNEPIVFDLINNSSHLYQMKKQYELNINETVQRIPRNGKLLFNDCIQLYDETKEIMDILSKYQEVKKPKLYNVIPIDVQLAIIQERDLTYQQIADKYNICVASVSNIFCKYNIIRKEGSYSEDELQNIFNKNKEMIIKNNGVVSRAITAKNLGISVQNLERLMIRNNIPIKRMYPRTNINFNTLNKFVILCNENVKRKDIKNILNLNDTEYNSYRCIGNKQGRIISNRQKYDKEYIKKWIIDNGSNLTNKQISEILQIPLNIIQNITNQYNLKHKVDKSATKITLEIEQNVLYEYKQLGSLYKVHNKLGLHKNTIKKILLKHNIPIKNISINKNNTPVSLEEKQQIINLRFKEGKSYTQIHNLTGRSINVITKIIKQNK